MSSILKIILFSVGCLPAFCHAGWFSPSCVDLGKNLVRDQALRRDSLQAGPANPTDLVASLTTVDGRSYSSLTAPYKKSIIGIAYQESEQKSCRFSADVITKVERKDSNSFEVTLNNGKTFVASRYAWQGFFVVPFSQDGALLLDKDNNYSEVLIKSWFSELQLLTIKHEPATDADKELWQKGKASDEAVEARRVSERKVALAKEEARKAEEAAAEQERQRRAWEARQATLPLVKTVGQKICLTSTGTENVYTGIAVLGQPQYRQEPRTFEVSGVTEKAAGDRVLIRIGAIKAVKPSGDASYSTELKGDPTYQVNQASWDEANKWIPCR